MTEPLIRIRGLKKIFNSKETLVDSQYALKNVNLDVHSGDIYGIIGMSGAGKSTLMRCLTGLEQPTEGSIFLNNKEMTREAFESARQEIGMIFQHFHLFSSRTVAKNMSYPLELQGVSESQQESRVEELLKLVGLENKKHVYPAQLSGGEKQRVGIARALANRPRLLLCDEPTSALDPKTSRSILQLLLTLNKTLGLTIVMITHQLEAIKQICTHVAVLAEGTIVEKGEVKHIFARPRHPVSRQLLLDDHERLPLDILSQQDPLKQLVRLNFEGHQTKEPVISQMVKRYQIEANILSGGLDYLQDTMIGHLIVQLCGPLEEVEKALQFLKSHHVNCEVIHANG